LISATKPGMTASFTYDGDGNRVEKNVNGTVTRYMVDGNNLTGYAQVVEELDAANAVQVVYTYGLDLISQNRKNTDGWTKSYYGYDATGTTRILFDDSGTVTDTYTYEAFGTIINRTGTTTNAYLFHGEQFDADLGLYYLRARYMDNNIGRFTTMDGFDGVNEDPSSIHKYRFVSNDPINRVDPSGYFDMIGASMAVAMYGNLSNFPSVMHPTFEGIGGPDVTKSVDLTLMDIKHTFTYNWSTFQKVCAAYELHDVPMAAIGVIARNPCWGAVGAWDIIPLARIGFGLDDNKLSGFYCGEYPWQRTVTYNNNCYYAGAVNYLMWGAINRLCHDYFLQHGDIFTASTFSCTAACSLVDVWKSIKYPSNVESQEAVAFTTAGYNNSSPGKGLPIRPSGDIVPTHRMQWCWEPVRPR